MFEYKDCKAYVLTITYSTHNSNYTYDQSKYRPKGLMVISILHKIIFLSLEIAFVQIFILINVIIVKISRIPKTTTIKCYNHIRQYYYSNTMVIEKLFDLRAKVTKSQLNFLP